MDKMTDKYLNSMLADHENILLVTRQHWIVLLQYIFAELLLSFGIILVVALVFILFPPASLLFLLLLLLLLFPFLSMLRDILKWVNHKYVVTNRRVIQIFGVINKNVTDSSLEKVNDIKMDQSFLGRLFDYGDVEILTASELGINRFNMIGDPIRFKTVMLNAKMKMENIDNDFQAAKKAQPDIPALLEQLASLRQHGILTEAEYQQKKTELLAKL
jgi:uncharacterized membrane protein YdbT with pleckstrin-like domain